jgi:hypothetical protein
MNYSVKKNKKVWGVFEHQTEQFVRSFPTKSEAITHSQFLNGGGAFDGFTPSFMVKA